MTVRLFPISEIPETCEGEIRLDVPQHLRRGSLRNDERRSIASAVRNMEAIATLTDRSDWSTLSVLDYGCGVKFTQALLQYQVNVKKYVGMDVFGELIQFLQRNVSLPGFEFFHVPFRNEMYNPNGIQLTADAELPGSTTEFDLMTLQSVLTHFKPADFLAILFVMRRYAAADARLFFTCFIDNDMASDFIDAVPGKPLMKAYYREAFVREMLEKSGWRPLKLRAPGALMQHQFVCQPC